MWQLQWWNIETQQYLLPVLSVCRNMRKYAIPVKEKPVLCIQTLIKKNNLQISRPLYCISNFFSFVIFMERFSLDFEGFSLWVGKKYQSKHKISMQKRKLKVMRTLVINTCTSRCMYNLVYAENITDWGWIQVPNII